MESTTKRQSSEKSTSRLSASAEPFTLKWSRAQSFNLPSSRLESDSLSLGDNTAQTFHYQDYASDGLGECLDLADYGAIAYVSESSGSNCFRNSELHFSPSDTARQKEKNTSSFTANQSLEKEGNNASQGSKSLNGSRNSMSGKSIGIIKEEAQARSQPKEQIPVEYSSLIKSSEQINSATISRSTHLSSSSIVSDLSLSVKPKDSEGGATAEGSLVVDKDDLNNKEPDEDSPCWRGTYNLKFPFTPDACSNTKFPENRSEASRTLNPMAPQYIPQCADRMLNLKGSRSSNADEIWETDREHSMMVKTGSLCLLSREVIPSFQVEEDITSNRNMVAGIEDVSFNEALLHISEHMSTCSTVDVELMVNIMHDLSEFIRKCSENQALGEPLLRKIQGIIQSLSLCKGDTGPGRSCSPPNMSSSDALKIPNMEIHPNVSMAVAELDNLSNCRLQKPDSSPFAKKTWDSCAFIGNIGAEIAQADSNASTAVLEMDQQVPLQTMLYKNLWLQATEELQSMKNRSLRNVKSGVGRFSGREP